MKKNFILTLVLTLTLFFISFNINPVKGVLTTEMKNADIPIKTKYPVLYREINAVFNFLLFIESPDFIFIYILTYFKF